MSESDPPDVIRDIFSGLDIIDRAIKSIGKAYHQVMKILDDRKARSLRERLLDLTRTMTGVNVLKIEVTGLLDHHIVEPRKVPWSDVKRRLLDVAGNIDAAKADLESNARNVIRVTGPGLVTDLANALREQIFKNLATLNRPARADLARMSERLKALLDTVRSLQTQLDEQGKAYKA